MNAIDKIKGSWTLMKTLKRKPIGYIGYNLTIYEKDDITIKHDFRSKSLKAIEKTLKKEGLI